MRRGGVVVAIIVLVAIGMLWRRHLLTAHRSQPSVADLGSRKGAERARPSPPLRLPTATAHDDAAAGAGELGGRVLSSADGKGIAHASLTFLHEGAAVSAEADE